MTFKFLDVVTILLNYCGPKLAESENKEMKAVIRDLIIIIGYFCANNRRNQVSLLAELLRVRAESIIFEFAVIKREVSALDCKLSLISRPQMEVANGHSLGKSATEKL